MEIVRIEKVTLTSEETVIFNNCYDLLYEIRNNTSDSTLIDIISKTLDNMAEIEDYFEE